MTNVNPLPGVQVPLVQRAPGLPRQFPTIRDPRYPTVKQWLEYQAQHDRTYRQPTGFTLSPNEVKAFDKMGEYLMNIPEAKGPRRPYTPAENAAFDEMG